MKIKACKTLTTLVIAVCSSASAQQKSTTLQINVERLSYGESSPKPFQGIGTFDLFRGSSKLDGAKCPDKSGPSGRVVCTIPCEANDSGVMVVRVKPPSDQDVLAGWVTPAGRDVEVIRCAVRPATLSMTYEDAKFALNKLLNQQYLAGNFAGGGGVNGSRDLIGLVSGSSPFIDAFAKQATTVGGRSELIELHNLATKAASAPFLQTSVLSAEDKSLAESLAKWQLLSKSALLQAQIRQVLSSKGQSDFPVIPTTNLVTYRQYLDSADLLLEKNATSASVMRLADDVKTLQSVPSIGKDAAAADEVIRTWADLFTDGESSEPGSFNSDSTP